MEHPVATVLSVNMGSALRALLQEARPQETHDCNDTWRRSCVEQLQPTADPGRSCGRMRGRDGRSGGRPALGYGCREHVR